MTKTIITLDALQASEVIVEDGQGRTFRLQPSFKVGEFQLHQLITPEPEPQPEAEVTEETKTDATLCGAPTVKGTPCKRKPVEGSNRCKTHEGVILDGEEPQL